MLSAAVTTLCWITMAAALSGAAAASSAVVVVLAILVAFVGLPHGAADHRFAQTRLEPLLGRSWLAVFLLGYLAIAAAVVFGWVLAPAATIILFFLASAWHFGAEEPRLATGPQWFRSLARFARGGLVIWTPLVFRHDEVLQILASVAPRSSSTAVAAVGGPLWLVSVAMLAVATAGWGSQFLAAWRTSGRRRRVLVADNALVVSLALLFVLTGPLVSFPVFFCGWHSARGLRRLRRELGESWRQLALSLAPLTIAAIALIALTGGVLLPAATWNETLVRATFIGLSAVAVPHLLLHGLDALVWKTGGPQRWPVLQTGSPA